MKPKRNIEVKALIGLVGWETENIDHLPAKKWTKYVMQITNNRLFKGFVHDNGLTIDRNWTNVSSAY
jgi:hypothetical protein